MENNNKNKAHKPEYIKKQVNNDCQQFYGPLTGCVFAMPGSHIHMPSSSPIEPTSTVPIEATVPIEEIPAKPQRSLGRRKKALFETDRGTKDEARTQAEADRLKRYVHDHHMGREIFDSSPHTALNKVVAYFCQRWAEKGWISSDLNTAALYRFLKDDCHMECGVDEKPFGRAIRTNYNFKKKDPEIYDFVSTYFEE